MATISALAFFVSLFGAGQDDAGVPAADAEVTPIESDTFRMVTSYEPPAKERAMSPRVFLGLRAGGTYFERYRPTCMRPKRRGPARNCLGQQDRRGTWKLVHKDGGRFIQFDRGPLVRYAFDDVGLKLRAPRAKRWESLMRTEGVRCLTADDCGYFHIAHPACVGAWSCAKNECHFVCGQRDSIESLQR